MNLSVKLLLIFNVTTFLSTVDTKNLEPESKLIGGHAAKQYSHPYLVSLQARFLWIRAHVCGGAILNERWILSAAHCVAESWLIRILPMDAVAGTLNVNKFGPKAQVKTIGQRITHPLYEGGIGPYDIAVFQTVTPFVFSKEVKPIKLPTDGQIRSQRLSLVGWGVLKSTFFIPDLPNKLQEVRVTYVPYDECFEAINELLEGDESNPLDQEANLCTGPLTGGIAACEGDSGGPLVHYVPQGIDTSHDSVEDDTELYDKDNYNCTNEDITAASDEFESLERQNREDLIPVVVGVVSWGVSPCGKQGAPTVYTNVTSYIHFINYFINEDKYI